MNVDCDMGDVMKEFLLSLCIPTNGMTKWVIPVVESIYSQKCDDSLFEVVISDNGEESDLEEALLSYKKAHGNIKYLKSSSEGFMNQIDVFAAAKGKLLKFINHRSCLQEGTLEYFLDFSHKYLSQRPIVYFSNGALNFEGLKEYNSFSDFMCGLTYYASWTTGLAFWKEDFDRMVIDSYDPLHPHMAWLCYYDKKDTYIIDNRKLLKDITYAHKEKGKYNLFKAFAVDYVTILEQLCQKGSITDDCFNFLKNDLKTFLVEIYYKFVICNEPCSYDLSKYVNYLSKYYCVEDINNKALSLYKCNFVKNNYAEILEATKRMVDKIKQESANGPIYIYGAGSGGKIVSDVLNILGVTIAGFIDRNANEIKCDNKLPVYGTDIVSGKGYYIISVMSNYGAVKDYVKLLGGSDDKILCFFEELERFYIEE